MNYDTTIRQLKERRDFYAAAVMALEKIQTHENAATERRVAPQPKRKARVLVPDSDIRRTLHMSPGAAARALNVSYQTIYARRQRLNAKPANGSGETNASGGFEVALT